MFISTSENLYKSEIMEGGMPRLIIIRGNSGSGKTTVAKALQQKYHL
nr:zeta toxin family protein [uncultured Anaerosporobacter sp.]